jgi:hypothetical protein
MKILNFQKTFFLKNDYVFIFIELKNFLRILLLNGQTNYIDK